MSPQRRASDRLHPGYAPGLALVLLANLALWTALAFALRGCVG